MKYNVGTADPRQGSSPCRGCDELHGAGADEIRKCICENFEAFIEKNPDLGICACCLRDCQGRMGGCHSQCERSLFAESTKRKWRENNPASINPEYVVTI